MSTKESNTCSGGEPVTIVGPACCGAPAPAPKASSCCGPVDLVSIDLAPPPAPYPDGAYWIKGSIKTASGEIPRVGTSLVFRDTLGSWKARWGINRMNYRILPGLYGVGDPDAGAPVFVTANYKMTFDRLRKELTGMDAWILVLDTKGINVWCAAGKGTFGTAELVRRITVSGLSRVVTHRTVILPQLGAPGVSAHEVRKLSGFNVVYGPVRARDIKAFLRAGMKATKEMRTVEFGFADRLCLTPIELVGIVKPLAAMAAALLVVRLTGLMHITFSDLYPFIGAILIGAVVAPALLPWIPGRAFAFKGWLTGFIWTVAILYLKGTSFQVRGLLDALALLLLLPAISAYLALNFTGASTYTSLSGVKREMRFAVPAIVVSAAAGIGAWLAAFIV